VNQSSKGEMDETDSEFFDEIYSSSSDESSSDEEDQLPTSTNIERDRGRDEGIDHPRRVGQNGNRCPAILF